VDTYATRGRLSRIDCRGLLHPGARRVLKHLRAEWQENRRRPTRRLINGVMAMPLLTVLGGLPGLAAPWARLAKWPGHTSPEVHRWHDGQ